MYCKNCGVQIDEKAVVCGICGTKVKEDTIKVEVNNTINNKSGRVRNKWITFTLAILFGIIGIHKLYEGKYIQFIMYLLFSWTGFTSMFTFVDIVIVLCKPTNYEV